MNCKNAFSYFIWFLYSIAVCVGLLAVTNTMFPMGMVYAGVWLLFCGLFTLILYRKRQKSSYFRVIEILTVVLLVAAGIALRVSCIGNLEQESLYFDLAKVAENQSIPPVVHGAVYFYLQLLHLIFLVFGNKFVAAVWLQIILQIAAGGFIYFAVRKLVGAVSAVVMLGFLMLSPFGINQAVILSPESLFFFIFTWALYACAKCFESGKYILKCILTGMLLAIACYLDVSGLVLLVFVITGCLQRGKMLKNILVCGLSAMAGFFLLILLDSVMSGNAWGNVLGAWWNLYTPGSFDLSVWQIGGLLPVEWLVLLMTAAMGIFSFWSLRKTEAISLWAFTAMALFGIQGFGMVTAEVSGNMEWYILLSVLAGNSIQMLFAKEMVAVESVWEDGKMEARLEALSVDVAEEEPTEQLTVEEIPAMPQVKFIENPLPLPKKHVKKVLDFDRELEEGQDDFDIEISEDDDFDI